MDGLFTYLRSETPELFEDFVKCLSNISSCVKNILFALDEKTTSTDMKDINFVGNTVIMRNKLRLLYNTIKFWQNLSLSALSISDDKENEKKVFFEIDKDNSNFLNKSDIKTTILNIDSDYDLKNDKPSCFLFNGVFYPSDSWKNLLLTVCEILYSLNSELFCSFVNDKSMQGKRRTYFSYNKKNISGRYEKIKKSPVFVQINFSARDIIILIDKMLRKFEMPEKSARIITKNEKVILCPNYENKKGNEKESIKIGQMAKIFFTDYFSKPFNWYMVKNFLDKDWCHDTFGINYPFLKKINRNIPITQQKNYNNEYGRYWVKPILNIYNNDYIMCSQWFDSFRDKLIKWQDDYNNRINNFPIFVVIDQKKYSQNSCLKCNTDLGEQLFCKIKVSESEGKLLEKLIPYKLCKECKTKYMGYHLYNSFTKNGSKVPYIHAKFILE